MYVHEHAKMESFYLIFMESWHITYERYFISFYISGQISRFQLKYANNYIYLHDDIKTSLDNFTRLNPWSFDVHRKY
jgi:hypothetical protein